MKVFTRMMRKLFVAEFAALVALVSMAPAGAQEIRVGGRTEPIVIGMANGWFKEAGVTVKVVEIPNFMQYPNLLASNSIDLLDGYIPANLWNMLASGAQFKIVSGSALAVAAKDGQPARNARAYVVRKDLWDSGAVRKISDLKGRKVADFAPVPPKGQLSPFPIGHKVFGETFKEVNWVRVPNETDMMVALDKKDLDGARMRTRFARIAINKGLVVELVKETDIVPRIQVRAVVAREEFAKQNADLLVRFLRVYLRAQAYAREVQKGMHTDEYRLAVKEHGSIPPEIALEVVQEQEFTEDLAMDDLLDTQKHFVMVGAQSKVVPLDQAVDLRYLQQAKARP